ncbi:hypothetical protein GCM10028805_14300 [Spirosoma harenae]
MAVTCVRDYPSGDPNPAPPVVTNPPGGGLPGQVQQSPQKRLYLGNDKIRLGIDLNAGGAITYLSEAGSNVNMVNNNDLGRQIQTSIYAGPNPYSVNGKDPVYQWRNLGWNPVQTGDYYNHPAKVVSYQQGQNTLYVKTIPLIWPLFNEPADCVFEHWIEIKENTVHIRCKVVVNRVDTTYHESRTQEVPCMYLNAPYYRIITYDGLKPFSNGTVSEYFSQENLNKYCTENWIALLNTDGRGVGLYKPNGEVRFSSAGFGNSHVGTEYDISSGYVTSQPHVLIDHNSEYEYECTLIVGSLNDIRQFVYSQPRPPIGPNYTFTKDRQGWYYRNTRDKGWPIQNELNVRWQRTDQTIPEFRILSPFVFWYASDVPKLYLNAAFRTKGTTARFVWQKSDYSDIHETPGRYIDFPIIGDGQFRTYELNLSQVAGWDGVIKQIYFTSPPAQYGLEEGSTVQIRSVTMTK